MSFEASLGSLTQTVLSLCVLEKICYVHIQKLLTVDIHAKLVHPREALQVSKKSEINWGKLTVTKLLGHFMMLIRNVVEDIQNLPITDTNTLGHY